jgi:hypothetical protein
VLLRHHDLSVGLAAIHILVYRCDVGEKKEYAHVPDREIVKERREFAGFYSEKSDGSGWLIWLDILEKKAFRLPFEQVSRRLKQLVFNLDGDNP